MPPTFPLDRFVAKFLIGDGCWGWVGPKTESGYGKFTLWGGTRRAHRVAYALFLGEVPDGFELDHLCRNRACVRPDHLEAVSHRENTLRGVGPPALNAAKAACKHGHTFDEENTYIRSDPAIPNGRIWRACRTCGRERANRKRHGLRKQALMNQEKGD